MVRKANNCAAMPAQAETRSCLHDAAINGLAAEIRTLAARIDGMQRAFSALNAIRLALEAKTWIAFHQRRSGHVAGGCARAATATRRTWPLSAGYPARVIDQAIEVGNRWSS